jgi:hypothetical protein
MRSGASVVLQADFGPIRLSPTGLSLRSCPPSSASADRSGCLEGDDTISVTGGQRILL